MIDEKLFEEKLTVAIAHKERLKKYKRLSRLSSEVKRKLWIQKMWLPLGGIAAASVAVIVYLTGIATQQEVPALDHSILISQEDLTKENQQNGHSSMNRNLYLNNANISQSNKNILPLDSGSIKSVDFVLEDNDQIAFDNKTTYSLPYDKEYKNEKDVLRPYLESENISTLATNFSAKSHHDNNFTSNKNLLYCPAIMYHKEGTEIIETTTVVLKLNHHLEDKYFFKKDTIILNLSNNNLLLKLQAGSSNKGILLKLWIDSEAALVIDTRKITGDYLRINKG